MHNDVYMHNGCYGSSYISPHILYYIYIHTSHLIFYITYIFRHGVINLTHTVGITQNFCSACNFEQVWCKTREGHKLMAAKWMNQLDQHYPQLGDKARALNK